MCKGCKGEVDGLRMYAHTCVDVQITLAPLAGAPRAAFRGVGASNLIGDEERSVPETDAGASPRSSPRRQGCQRPSRRYHVRGSTACFGVDLETACGWAFLFNAS